MINNSIKEIDNGELVTLKWYLEILIEGMYRLLFDRIDDNVNSIIWMMHEIID